VGLNGLGAPGDENAPVRLEDMVGHYHRSKFLAEQAVSELVANDQLPIVIVNPATPVGPRDIKPTATGRMILGAAAGRIPAYVNTGLNVVGVDDVAAGHLAALERGRIGERYSHNSSCNRGQGDYYIVLGRLYSPHAQTATH
jgi:dihydroflavonol-4-reductase